jgi:hypothetical protein
VTDGRILDATALADAATGRTLYARALIRTAVEHNITLAIPTTALLAAWADIPTGDRPFLDLALELPVAVLDVLDADAARDSGLLLADADRSSGLDSAHTALSARRRQWAVVTSQPGRLHAIDPDLEIEQLP